MSTDQPAVVDIVFPEADVVADEHFLSVTATTPTAPAPMEPGQTLSFAADAEMQIAHRMAGHRRPSMKRVGELMRDGSAVTDYE